jgi:hypothetical protein
MNETIESGGRPGEDSLATRLGGQRTQLREAAPAVGPFLAGWLVPFALVLYLALRGGGYDQVVNGEVGVVVWWLVALGALIGLLPRGRPDAAAWTVLGLLIAFIGWTALGISWSSTAEQSVDQLALVAVYLGVFVLGLTSNGPGGLRRTAGAIATAIGIVGALALLSRVHPSWFPTDVTGKLIPNTQSRLNYPLGYWNGLAALIAIGIPLLITAATRGRWLAARALAAAALPALALAAYYTYSRGGVVEIAIALLALVALHPRRLSLLPTMGVAAVSSAILIAAARQRGALANGLHGPTAHSQGDEMLAIALVVCAGAALIQVAIALAGRHGLGPRPAISRRTAVRAFGISALVAVVVAIAAGFPGFVSDRWQEFKSPQGASVQTAARYDSASGNGRYQYWQSTVHENATDPLLGTGPGTFQYWWAKNGTIPGFVRNAHSLYFETLGELGIVGLVLIAGAILVPLGVGIRRTWRADLERRTLLAGVVASSAVFAVAAGVDWVWQIPVIPVAFLLLAAALLAGRDPEAPQKPGRPMALRAGIGALAVAALVAIAIPLYSAIKVNASQAAVRAHDLPGALDDARSAASIEPYAATPKIQEALVLELQRRLPQAIAAEREATQAEATNWRTWLVLSRLELKNGNVKAAVAAYRRGRSLNPRSPIFAQ